MARNVRWDLVEKRVEGMDTSRFVRWLAKMVNRSPAAIMGVAPDEWQEMTDQEIADRLGVAVGTVKSLEQRAARGSG